MTTPVLDAQPLFEFAKNWYQTNPGSQIPDDEWLANLAEIIAGHEGLYVKFRMVEGERSITTPSPRIIPALAAISLGLTNVETSAIARHHKTDLGDLSSCAFGFIFKPAEERSNQDLTKWMVTKSMLRAFCYEPGDVDLFFGSVKSRVISPTQAVAFLTVPNPSVWPATGIYGHLQCARQGREAHNTQLRPMISADSFSDAKIDLDSLSDAHFIQLLERSGNLALGATSENGIYSTFFMDMLHLIESNDDKNHLHLIGVLNRLGDETIIGHIRKRILEDLCDVQPGLLFGNAESIISGLEKHFDHDKFGRMHDDIVLKLNVVKVTELDTFAASTARAIPKCYSEFFNEGELILSRLNEKLREIDPPSFRAPHFRALKVATVDWDREQDTESFDLSALLSHALEGFDAYLGANHVDLSGNPKHECKDEARDHMVAFATYAIDHIDHDYKRFSSMSSEAKTILAIAGLDIKKLPGITRHDRGRVLSDQLGL